VYKRLYMDRNNPKCAGGVNRKLPDNEHFKGNVMGGELRIFMSWR